MPESSGYIMVVPHWTDTDAYTDRDRAMFASGEEFGRLIQSLRTQPGRLATTIRRENESRVRMACGTLGRSCRITPYDADKDPAGIWSHLEVEPR